jgi:Tfp pilus assembly protein PilF
LNPEYEPAHLELLAVRLATGNADGAVEAYKNAVQRLQPGFRLFFMGALIQARLTQYDEAFSLFQQAEALAEESQPELLNHRFYFQVGAMLEQAGKIRLAEEYLEKSLKIDPDFDEALNHLGYMWAEKGKNLEQAHDMIVRALVAEPDNPAYLDSLGWVLYKLGRYDEALAPMLRAAEMMKETPDSVVLDHLGDVHAALKQWEKARDAWRGALEADPTLELEAEIRRKLDTSKE